MHLLYVGGCTTYRKTLVGKEKKVSTPVKRKKLIRSRKQRVQCLCTTQGCNEGRRDIGGHLTPPPHLLILRPLKWVLATMVCPLKFLNSCFAPAPYIILNAPLCTQFMNCSGGSKAPPACVLYLVYMYMYVEDHHLHI